MDKSEGDSIQERVQAVACHYLPCGSSNQRRVTEVRRIAGRRTAKTRIFQIEGDGSSCRIFVKVYSPEKRGDYDHEVKALTALAGFFGPDSGYRMPRLLDSWEDLNAVVLQAIEGEALAQFVRRKTKEPPELSRRRVLKLFTDVGGWLAHLHNATYEGEAELGADRASDLHHRLESALARRPLTSAIIGRRVLACSLRLLDIEQRTRGLLLPVARSHGDFNMSNLMTDGEHLWGIDPCGNRLEPVYIEVTHFAATLRMERSHICCPRRLRQRERSFLMGYARGVKFPVVNRRLGLRLCSVYARLRLLANALERWKTDPKGAPIEAAWIWFTYLRPLQAYLRATERVLESQPPGSYMSC